MLAWLDFDSDAMKRAHELLQQFRDARTLDHLRLGGVRDDFANYFFPATSTIMPHARYLVLVPRAFLQLEAQIRKKGCSLQEAVKRLDDIEASQAKELIAELGTRLKKREPDRKDLEGSGIIGWDKIRETNGTEFVSQTPSNSYWASIRKLQIRIPKGSRVNYIRDIMARAKNKSSRSGVPEEESLGLESVIWNKDVLELSKEASACLELSEKQAKFIQRQYVGLNSLMSRLLSAPAKEIKTKADLSEFRYVWDYPLPSGDDPIIESSRRLSALIQGANLLYGTLVANEYGLESHQDFNAWRPALDEWFASPESGLGAKSAKRTEWASISIICKDRYLDIDFLKKIQANLKSAKSPSEFMESCGGLITCRERTVKSVSYRLGRIEGGGMADKKKLRERVIRQPARLTQAPDFRWGMASEFMWNINSGLGVWG
ncbi:DUF6361 family protein (plasmid) [Bradyrhizobium barranii subsp. barranii]|uniref:DUF6361 family protein n=1 Tax=Bradyrhizobium barranii subsp. barranii TaxID=2823807 RepID=A0A7Z0TYC3_9BRAD|nr:DUF6361 family protein [Bradyrhizobium barranii]UGX89714.1 DUF6361 family protein [Bradyrhizobium barranii subsp. barranii]